MHDDTTSRPSGEPRLLHQVATPHGGDEAALLSAWAGCCTSPGTGSTRTAWVALEGELDAFSASQLRAPLADFAADVGDLVVDLRGLRFVDSAGVGLLEEVSRRQLRRGGFVRFHGAGPRVRRVMRLVADADAATGRADPGLTSPAASSRPPEAATPGGRAAAAPPRWERTT